MAIAEILMTKKECFTVFENGHIAMKKGEYVPTEAPVHDVYPKPEKPKLGPIEIVQQNIWGEELFRANAEILSWQMECRNVEEMNALAHQKQEKEFKRHVVDVRRAYYLQEKQRKIRQKMGARAYLKNLLQR